MMKITIEDWVFEEEEKKNIFTKNKKKDFCCEKHFQFKLSHIFTVNLC